MARRGWVRACGAAGLALVFGCARQPAPEAAEELAGATFRLRASGAVRLAVEGRVGERPAEVLLEVAQPISLVTEGCFDAPPESSTTVRYPRPEGGTGEGREVSVGNAQLGDMRLGPLTAALIEGTGCELTLGSDVLGRYALEVDPAQRTVRLLPSAPRESYLAQATSQKAQDSGLEHHLVELARDPAADWPLLAARARQGEEALTGAFVLVTSVGSSGLGVEAAKEAALRVGPRFLRELEVPADVPLPDALGGALYAVDKLELAPGFGLANVDLAALADWKTPGTVGRLAGDVWGRFQATIDPAAGVMVLRRPRVFVSGPRQRCATGPAPASSEEACFVLHQRPLAKGGVEWVATVWRQLPKGGRIYLEVVDANGKALDGACRVGMTFARADRGLSAAHTLPWPGLERAVPACAKVLGSAAQVRFGIWQEGALEECPGTCAFVQDRAAERVSCECQGNTLSLTPEAERRFLERYKEALEKGGAKPKAQPERDEPEDDL